MSRSVPLDQRRSVAVILGAGFSVEAGLPLGQGLFSEDVFAASEKAARRLRQTLAEWNRWKSIKGNQHPEMYLAELWQMGLRGADRLERAIVFIAASLATPRRSDRGPHNQRYANRITRPLWVAAHHSFWQSITEESNLVGVVATNYDLCVERGLRNRPMSRPKSPGMHYGGFGFPQLLQGTAMPFSVRKYDKVVELTGSVPLYKLHGSLNWSVSDEQMQALKMYQDTRAAFRRGGSAFIVPPLPEKEAPRALQRVWREAAGMLGSTSNWVVCGYSLPSYDYAIRDWISGTAGRIKNLRILVMDPHSKAVSSNWQSIAPQARIVCSDGLPGGINELRNFLRSGSSP